jgi:hypothetical protein
VRLAISVASRVQLPDGCSEMAEFCGPSRFVSSGLSGMVAAGQP